jgi:hypothetical protein
MLVNQFAYIIFLNDAKRCATLYRRGGFEHSFHYKIIVLRSAIKVGVDWHIRQMRITISRNPNTDIEKKAIV